MTARRRVFQHAPETGHHDADDLDPPDLDLDADDLDPVEADPPDLDPVDADPVEVSQPTTKIGVKAMATNVFKIEKGEVGFSLVDPTVDVADATIGDYDAYSCVVTSGVVTSSANFDTDEIPATMCDPASETVTPSAATFSLDLEVLQDPDNDDAATGLAAFLWENDSGVSGSPVWFYLGLAEGADPKIIGQCYLTPMDFGGPPREVLTASLTFPIEGRPTPSFGTAADA